MNNLKYEHLSRLDEGLIPIPKRKIENDKKKKTNNKFKEVNTTIKNNFGVQKVLSFNFFFSRVKKQSRR